MEHGRLLRTCTFLLVPWWCSIHLSHVCSCPFSFVVLWTVDVSQGPSSRSTIHGRVQAGPETASLDEHVAPPPVPPRTGWRCPSGSDGPEGFGAGSWTVRCEGSPPGVDRLAPAPTGRSVSVGSVPLVVTPWDTMADERCDDTGWSVLCRTPFECGRHVLDEGAAGMNRFSHQEATMREESRFRWPTRVWPLLFYQGEGVRAFLMSHPSSVISRKSTRDWYIARGARHHEGAFEFKLSVARTIQSTCSSTTQHDIVYRRMYATLI